MKWFKHDADASIDAKIERLIMRFGLEGYGLYFYCLELIVASIEEHNINFELEHDAEIIGHRTGTHPDHVQEMMKYMIDLGLFENNNGQITCFKIVKRLDSSMTSNPKLRSIIKAFHDKSHDGVMTKSCSSHDGVMLDKKRKEENRDNAKTPTLDEVRAYIQEKGYDIDAEKFFNHYESSNWHRGKTKIVKWKSCIATWLRNSPKESTPALGEWL